MPTSRKLWIRLQRISVDIPNLARAVLVVEVLLEQQGFKEAYEIKKTGIRDDQAPIICVECKRKKHWKLLERVNLLRGAGVNVLTLYIKVH